MRGKVSIVIPVYKVEDNITICLQSIVNQTYKNFEIILVDDGSPDLSAKIAEDFLIEKKVEWRIIHQPNMGLPSARNNGIKEAKGEWVICPDSDDFLAPVAIENMIKAAYDYDVDCVFCGFKKVFKENYTSLPKYNKGIKIYEISSLRTSFFNKELILLFPAMLAKREIYNDIQFDPNCRHDEDIHFMWQLFYKVTSVAYIDADYYNYYMRSTSMSHTLTPDNYLKASSCYKKLSRELILRYPGDKLIPKLPIRYRIGAANILARSNNFSVFRNTILSDGYRKDMHRLYSLQDMKLTLYTLLFCTTLRWFYFFCKKIR